jgi:ribonuclease VapC
LSTPHVLDSYALLAYFGGEEGAEVVRGLLAAAERGDAVLHLSVVNLGEIAYISERAHGRAGAERVIAAIDQLPISVESADLRRTLDTAHLKASYPIAYADAFALALAVEMDAALVTGDPEFGAAEDLVEITWLRPA